MNYYWKLEPYNGTKSRFTCPSCGKKNEYTRYINSEGEYAPIEFGICNRKEKCGHNRYPNKDQAFTNSEPFKPTPEPPQEYLDWEELKLQIEEDSNLFSYLSNLLGSEATFKAFERYFVSTEGNRTIYPYIDSKNRLTQYKSIEYDTNGHRTSQALWAAKKGRNLKSGLFGEHLLKNDTIPHIVEGEKTALICSIAYPEDTWLATGGLGMISRAFHIKKAVIYPDKGKAFKEWKAKSPNSWVFDKTVEESSQLKEGEDLADLICIC